MSRTVIHTDKAPPPIGPYNQAIRAGETVYISGQIAIDPRTKKFIRGSIEEETQRVLQNIGAILEAADLDFEEVVKCTVYVDDLKDYDAINSVYTEFFSEENGPARELVEVSALPRGAAIEISAMARSSSR